MSEPVKVRRYDSTRRRAQAEATRRDILKTAKVMFEQDGYAATTMPAIAARAGVAPKTVYTGFGTKSGVLHAVWDMTLGGDDSQTPVAAREWYLEVLDEPDPARQLQLNARNSRVVKERIAAVLDVIRNAAQLDPAVGALWLTIQKEFHDNQRVVVERLHQKKVLKEGLTIADATDILWTLNHPNTWQLLVGERHWTAERFETWFAMSACEQLLRRQST
jgi:AcrR family transcriptional regulator